MGSSNYSRDAYSHISANLKGKTVDQTFTQQAAKKIHNSMSPVGVAFRESRDSANHPESLAVMVWLDGTGSMGEIPRVLVSEKLDKIMGTLIDHEIKDSSVFFGVIGDVKCDEFPLQVGQFESGADELVKCLTTSYLEGGGGGNGGESYSLAHYFGGKHTSIDCFEKRQQKGFLFTIGDEPNHSRINKDEFRKVFESGEFENMSDTECLDMAQRLYHVFHIHINHSSDPSYDSQPVSYWKKLLGERLIIAENYNNVAEIIASTIAAIHGIDLESVLKSFDAGTAADVRTALAPVNLSMAKNDAHGGVVTL